MSERLIGFEVDGYQVTFSCDARNTRNGFAHDATIFINGRMCKDAHCYYLNRTWEAWRFQSVCLAAVTGLIDQREYDLKEDYKHENGLTRVLGKKRHEELIEKYNSDSLMGLYRKIKKILNERSF